MATGKPIRHFVTPHDNIDFNSEVSEDTASEVLKLLCVCARVVCRCQCPSCGRDDSGRCIGPHICCRHDSRCEYDSAVCHRENLLPTPCTLPAWPRCGQQKLCVTPTQCCDDGEINGVLRGGHGPIAPLSPPHTLNFSMSEFFFLKKKQFGARKRVCSPLITFIFCWISKPTLKQQLEGSRREERV